MFPTNKAKIHKQPVLFLLNHLQVSCDPDRPSALVEGELDKSPKLSLYIFLIHNIVITYCHNSVRGPDLTRAQLLLIYFGVMLERLSREGSRGFAASEARMRERRDLSQEGSAREAEARLSEGDTNALVHQNQTAEISPQAGPGIT